MPPELDHEDDYASEEDSDFAPEDARAEESSAFGDEEEGEGDGVASTTANPSPEKRKRPGADDAAEDAGFENSGDEAIIEKGKKKRKRKNAQAADEDEGGEGGLVKTRSMRAVEKAERKAATSNGPVTVDVDALWAQMMSEPIVSSSSQKEQPTPISQPGSSSVPKTSHDAQPTTETANSTDQSDLIRIKHTYNFAGKVHTEEKLVPRDSAEAKLYLAENPPLPSDDTPPEPKRVLKKAFRSAFEPVTAEVLAHQRSDLNLGVSVRLRARELANGTNAKKLNTVEKSRMDWAGFVDKEGIKDELELAGKSKHSFAARQDFLARSEALREEEARKLRMTGKA
ncbi:bucentaur or craniofacial development-domain-containing protein [Podospora australis]|uniref:SWR1-complex protein 5 n=1 Tax=Podospora australis TaxID=1536484 RepID=A0AAN7AKG0_9PEZI|nr:bucentaur or craniofacial development-domain-containing protein [Podospora australis]